jgi:LAO/AO transport system kinase
MTLVESVLRGDRLALARLLTQVENNTSEGRLALGALFPRTGKAHLIGVTGAPGTGKSSLVNRLALHYRGQDRRVAIAAVDPSSPFTGGAVLGDRVRMKDLSGDDEVFIRSMASRGTLGGLAQTTAGIVQVFDAAGYQVILIETVGAGQGEVDVARLAHTTLVVEAPGLGDDIQAIKAGILEIADILVVNKADRPGVENTEKALRSVLELARPMRRTYLHHGQALSTGPEAEPETEGWNVPIQRTISTEGSGIPELAGHIENHRRYLRESGNWAVRETARLASEVDAILQQTLMQHFRSRVGEGRYNEVMRRVFAKDLSPWEAVSELTNGSAKIRAAGMDHGRSTGKASHAGRER